MNVALVRKRYGSGVIHRRAVGYVNSSLPGWPENEELVCAYALMLGYTLVRLVIFHAVAADEPIERLLEAARAHGADAVVVADLGHVAGSLARLCAVCDVETVYPPATFTCTGNGVEGEI